MPTRSHLCCLSLLSYLTCRKLFCLFLQIFLPVANRNKYINIEQKGFRERARGDCDNKQGYLEPLDACLESILKEGRHRRCQGLVAVYGSSAYCQRCLAARPTLCSRQEHSHLFPSRERGHPSTITKLSALVRTSIRLISSKAACVQIKE